MLTFKRLFTYSFNNNLHMLGRWIINYDENIINTKVDQANEDHCGCCAFNTNHLKNNNFKNKKKSLIIDITQDDEYYKAFII
jgi:hypothetical protein